MNNTNETVQTRQNNHTFYPLTLMTAIHGIAGGRAVRHLILIIIPEALPNLRVGDVRLCAPLTAAGVRLSSTSSSAMSDFGDTNVKSGRISNSSHTGALVTVTRVFSEPANAPRAMTTAAPHYRQHYRHNYQLPPLAPIYICFIAVLYLFMSLWWPGSLLQAGYSYSGLSPSHLGYTQ